MRKVLQPQTNFFQHLTLTEMAACNLGRRCTNNNPNELIRLHREEISIQI